MATKGPKNAKKCQKEDRCREFSVSRMQDFYRPKVLRLKEKCYFEYAHLDQTFYNYVRISLAKSFNYYAPRPAEQSEAGRGAFYFLANSDWYRVTTG